MANRNDRGASGGEGAPPEAGAAAAGAFVRPRQVILIRGSDKEFALDQLVASAARILNLGAERQVELADALRAREAELNTQLGQGWAAPHVPLDGLEELVLVVGRSRAGIDYGREELGRVHLFFLFVYSSATHEKYLKALAELAELFRGPAGPERLERALKADSPDKLRRALGFGQRRTRVVLSRRLPAVARVLIRTLLRFAEEIDAGAIVLFSDVFRNQSLLTSFISQRIVLATRSAEVPDALAARARGVVRLGRSDITEESAVQLALLSAGARGLLGEGGRVVAVCGARGSDTFDTVRIETPRLMISRIYSRGGKETVAPEVFERAVQLLVELAEEGREGRRVGTIVVLGDSAAVRGMSQQLTINPFRGYGEQERNLLDPALEETIKEFAGLDGAFVVNRHGIIQSAGTYLSPPAEVRVDLVSGLGTRHRVAAAITKATRAVALVLSQSTGRITVFRGGKEVLTVSPSRSHAVAPEGNNSD
jgi:diadenylate cyclase